MGKTNPDFPEDVNMMTKVAAGIFFDAEGNEYTHEELTELVSRQMAEADAATSESATTILSMLDGTQRSHDAVDESRLGIAPRMVFGQDTQPPPVSDSDEKRYLGKRTDAPWTSISPLTLNGNSGDMEMDKSEIEPDRSKRPRTMANS